MPVYTAVNSLFASQLDLKATQCQQNCCWTVYLAVNLLQPGQQMGKVEPQLKLFYWVSSHSKNCIDHKEAEGLVLAAPRSTKRRTSHHLQTLLIWTLIHCFVAKVTTMVSTHVRHKAPAGEAWTLSTQKTLRKWENTITLTTNGCMWILLKSYESC